MESDSGSDSDSERATGFCHFNENGKQEEFELELFGIPISLHQEPNSTHIGHGAVIWDAAVIFSKYMELNPKDFTNLNSKTVIEFGSGCGLAGLSFLLKGCDVCFTDLEIVTQNLTSPNITKSFRKFSSAGAGVFKYPILPPRIIPLDWTASLPCELENQTFDIVLLTDCVFSVALVPHLIEKLIQVCRSSSIVYCCHEIRDEMANNLFVATLKQHFRVRRVSRSRLHPSYSNDCVELLVAKPLRERTKERDRGELKETPSEEEVSSSLSEPVEKANPPR